VFVGMLGLCAFACVNVRVLSVLGVCLHFYLYVAFVQNV